jgi:poly-gamma-glutamate synthesis protein (capsule biosynthesis protein)
MDMGSAGIEKELEFFSEYPEVVHTGTAITEEDAQDVTYTTVNGITFALLNYTYGTNGITVPEDKPYLVNILSRSKVRKDVALAKEKADVIIVFPHWGTQNSRDITSQQKKYTKLFSELGVDIVIGTNPHVLQKVEWVNNSETGKKMLVYYSLGNFISHQTNLEQLLGGMAEITVERRDGEISITDAKLTPLVTYYEMNADGYRFTTYTLKDYSDELADRHNADKATPEYFRHLAKTVVSEDFLNLK